MQIRLLAIQIAAITATCFLTSPVFAQSFFNSSDAANQQALQNAAQDNPSMSLDDFEAQAKAMNQREKDQVSQQLSNVPVTPGAAPISPSTGTPGASTTTPPAAAAPPVTNPPDYSISQEPAATTSSSPAKTSPPASSSSSIMNTQPTAKEPYTGFGKSSPQPQPSNTNQKPSWNIQY